MEELRNVTVLITGASRGLGAALAHAFAAAGARLALCARGEREVLAVAARLRAAGAECMAAALDVTSEVEVEEWVRDAERRLGPPGVLVNNASVLGPRVPLADYPLQEWRRTLEVNLTGTFVVTRAVLPHMLGAGRGSIINVSSGASIPPRPEWGAYAVSKDAVDGLSLSWAEELRGSGVRVNVVDPGAMRTRMRAEAYPEEDPATLKDAAASTPVFLWLAGNASRAVTGQRFRARDWVAEREDG